MTTSHALAGLESRHGDKEATARTGEHSGNHEAHAGDAADASRACEAEEEIEVTPEMIYEGVEAFYTQNLDIEDADEVVKRIYLAMHSCRRQPLLIETS